MRPSKETGKCKPYSEKKQLNVDISKDVKQLSIYNSYYKYIQRIKGKYNDNVKTNKNTQHSDLGS